VQQDIFPPLLYAGGLFRFSIEVRDTGRPVIELSLGVVASIGGELIPGLPSSERCSQRSRRRETEKRKLLQEVFLTTPHFD
jgi:hypothetical protein